MKSTPRDALASRWLGWVGAIVGIALVMVGVIVEGWPAMAANVYAMVAGLVLTVSLVAIILEHFERQRRRTRWNQVKVHTLSSIEEHLRAATGLLLADREMTGGPPPVFAFADRQDLTADNLSALHEVMLERVRPMTIADADTLDYAFTPALNGVAYHLRPIVDAYSPIVLTFDDDTELIGALVSLAHRTEFIRRWPEDGERAMRTATKAGLVGPPLRLGPEQAKLYLLDLLESSSVLAECIRSRLPTDSRAPPWRTRVRAAFPEAAS